MFNRRRLLTSAAALATFAGFVRPREAKADRAPNMHITLISRFQVMRFIDVDAVDLLNGKDLETVRLGDVFHDHTLVAILPGDCVVLEDCRSVDGHMLIVDKIGVRFDLTRTAESTSGTYSQDFASLRLQDRQGQSLDPLGDAILAKTGSSQEADPQYDPVAAVFPPIRNIAGGVYNFVGSYKASQTIPFAYGGRSSHFDPAHELPALEPIIVKGLVRDGLVGGYLPCLRFVYTEADHAWTELLAFAPFEAGPISAWYRLTRIVGGKRVESQYFGKGTDSTGNKTVARDFYSDLNALKVGWDRVLQPAMSLDVPDERLGNIARHSLIRILMGNTQKGVDALQAWGLMPPEILTPRAVETPADGIILGMPTTDDGEVSAILSGNYAYGLVRQDRIREALLTVYSTLAHQFTRGMWLATASRYPLKDEAVAAWTPMAQATVPFMIRALLVFEDPAAEILWLGKGTPRQWLEDEKLSFIDNAPTRWGRVSFAFDSRRLKEHRIACRVTFPKEGIAAETRLRLRSHDAALIRSVVVNNKGWRQFDPASGTITLPSGMGGEVLIDVRY